MQVANVVPVIKPELVGKINEPALSQHSEVAIKSVVVDSPIKPNYRRMFEAFNDCV